MKTKLISLLLASALTAGLYGCALSRMGQQIDAAEDALERAVQTAATLPAGLITKEEAQSVALKHAGLTAEQVTFLRTEYEVDEGRPQYEVSFHRDRWEYDYEIDAETGELLSFDRDD